MTLAAIVDGGVLWRLVVAALGGGIGVTLAFSLVILGSTRSLELRRDGRMVGAGAFALLAAVALLAVAVGVVYGVSLLAQKT